MKARDERAAAQCPACCGGNAEPGRGTGECPWLTDMLEIFSGLLFIDVVPEQLARLAPCRRSTRHATAGSVVAGPIAEPATQRPRMRHLRLI